MSLPPSPAIGRDPRSRSGVAVVGAGELSRHAALAGASKSPSGARPRRCRCHPSRRGLPVAKSTVRGKPRWSVARPLATPASTARLVSAGRCVWVGPPLLVSGPSDGSVPVMFEPPAFGDRCLGGELDQREAEVECAGTGVDIRRHREVVGQVVGDDRRRELIESGRRDSARRSTPRSRSRHRLRRGWR